MQNTAFLSKPLRRRRREPARSGAPCPGRGGAGQGLFQCLGQSGIQAPDRQGLAQAARCKPGQFFNILCPSPDDGDLWLRRPQSIYAIDREGGNLEFLYKCVGRGTRGMATFKPGDDCNMVGPLGIGFSLLPEWWPGNIVVVGRGVGPRNSGADLRMAAASGVISGSRPSFRPGRSGGAMAAELFGEVGEVIRVLDSDGTSAVENVRVISGTADRGGRRTPSTPAARTG